MKSLENTYVPYLSASVVVIHYEEALYQVYAPYLTVNSDAGCWLSVHQFLTSSLSLRLPDSTAALSGCVLLLSRLSTD